MMKAFPVVNYKQPANGVGAHIMTIEGGMDLRDYFAAKAMELMLSDKLVDASFESISILAYEMADAMMKAREVK